MAPAQDSMKGRCHRRGHGEVCRGIWCSQRWCGVRVLGTLFPSPMSQHSSSSVQLSQQAPVRGQEAGGFRASKAGCHFTLAMRK